MEDEAKRDRPYYYREYVKVDPKKKKKRKKPKKRNRKTEAKRVYPPFQLAYRELLKREGFTQKTLADALGVNPSVVCRDLKRPNYIDPKMREYVEMLGYRIVLSFEKVSDPKIVKHEKTDGVKKMMETKRANSKHTRLGEEKTVEDIGNIAGKYGPDIARPEAEKDSAAETNDIALKYKEMNLDV